MTWTDACGDYFGIHPKYVDFHIVPVAGGNGYQATEVIGRFDYDGGSEGITFDTTVSLNFLTCKLNFRSCGALTIN